MDIHGPYLPPDKYRNVFEYERVANKSDEEIDTIWAKERDLLAEHNKNIMSHITGLYDCSIFYEDICIRDLLDFIKFSASSLIVRPRFP